MDTRIKSLVHFQNTIKSPNEISADLQIHEDLPSLRGHFPGNPILPAVSIIDISLFLLSELLVPVSHSHLELKKSKFMDLIKPNQRVSIHINSDDGKNWKILWVDQSNQNKLAQLHLCL